MQIYEITHHAPTNEVLGTMAAGVGKALANKFISSQLPGISLYGDDDKDTTRPLGTAAPSPAAPVVQKFPAFGSASTTASSAAPVPTVNYNIPATQRKQAAQAAAPVAPVQQPVQGWQGQNINVPAVQRKQAAQAAQTTSAPAPPAQPAATTPPAATPTPATTPPAATGIVPRAGHRIVVTVPAGGKYYKTDKGWTNEIGQAITKPTSVAALEKRADTSGREERLMPAKTTPPVRQRKRR
jgi:hypothetical protein